MIYIQPLQPHSTGFTTSLKVKGTSNGLIWLRKNVRIIEAREGQSVNNDQWGCLFCVWLSIKNLFSVAYLYVSSDRQYIPNNTSQRERR